MTKQYLEPVIEMVNGEPLTSTINMGDVFGKPHKSILRAIENLECSEEFMRLNFVPHSYIDARGNTQPMFLMTERGCAWLGTGFTGKKAAAFKEKYINAFDAMKKQLQRPAMTSRKELALMVLEQEQENERLLLDNKQKDSQIQALAIEAFTATRLKQSETTFSLSETAKLLVNALGLQMGPNQMIGLWRNKLKWIFRRSADGPNLPYESVTRYGLVTVLSDDEHGGKLRPQARFSGEGILWAYQQLCTHFNIPVSLDVMTYLRQFIARHINAALENEGSR